MQWIENDDLLLLLLLLLSYTLAGKVSVFVCVININAWPLAIAWSLTLRSCHEEHETFLLLLLLLPHFPYSCKRLQEKKNVQLIRKHILTAFVTGKSFLFLSSFFLLLVVHIHIFVLLFGNKIGLYSFKISSSVSSSYSSS